MECGLARTGSRRSSAGHGGASCHWVQRLSSKRAFVVVECLTAKAAFGIFHDRPHAVYYESSRMRASSAEIVKEGMTCRKVIKGWRRPLPMCERKHGHKQTKSVQVVVVCRDQSQRRRETPHRVFWMSIGRGWIKACKRFGSKKRITKSAGPARTLENLGNRLARMRF